MGKRRPQIAVVAGTNGAGKSSFAKQFIMARGGQYFDPDAVARRLVERGETLDEANARAWRIGFDTLRDAVTDREDFTFETTLGGNSIVRELHRAVDAGLQVRILYVGLASVQQHIARVRARVARGGHDVPERKIRERYLASHANLLSLLGRAAEVHVYDNSTETAAAVPDAQLVFRMKKNRITKPDLLTLVRETPSWAKPIVAEALRLNRQGAARSKK